MMRQFDICTAFLYGELDETIYMELPDGYKVDNCVCKLNKSLYGLKQAPRKWNEKFKATLRDFNLTQSEADPCVFYSHKDKDMLCLALYVDDGIIFSSSEEIMNNFAAHLTQSYKVKFGKPGTYLGLQFANHKNGFVVHQEQYIKKILERFNMSDCKPVSIPADTNVKFSSESLDKDIKFPYREAIGSLMYLATGTRPDLAYVVSALSQFISSPSTANVTAVKRIFRYLKSSTDYGLCFSNAKNDPKLEAYCDSNFAGDIDSRKSRSGFIFTLNGTAVTWSSTKQKTVALSTTEAEYISLCEAGKEAVWLRRLLSELKVDTSAPTKIYCDNSGSIKLASNPEFHRRTKHIDIKHHYIRQLLTSNVVTIEYISTEKNNADFLTKPLPVTSFSKFRSSIGLTRTFENE